MLLRRFRPSAPDPQEVNTASMANMGLGNSASDDESEPNQEDQNSEQEPIRIHVPYVSPPPLCETPCPTYQEVLRFELKLDMKSYCYCGHLVLLHKPRSFAEKTEVFDFSKYLATLPEWTPQTDIAQFLSRMEILSKAANVPSRFWKNGLLLKVPELLTDWVNEKIIDDPSVDWINAKQLFSQRFTSRDVYVTAHKEFDKIRQRANESVLLFSKRFEVVCKKLKLQDDNTLAIIKFQTVLLSDIAKEFVRHVAPARIAARQSLCAVDLSLQLSIEVALQAERVCQAGDGDGGSSPPTLANPPQVKQNQQRQQSSFSSSISSSSASVTSNKSANVSNTKPILKCIYHPYLSHSHTTADCTNNPANGGNGTILKSRLDKVQCRSCQQYGHYQAKCPSNKKPQSSVQSFTSRQAPSAPTSRSVELVPSPVCLLASRVVPSVFEAPKAIFKGQLFDLLFDTGATVSFIDASLVSRLHLPLFSDSVGGDIKFANGSTTHRLGRTQDLSFKIIFPSSYQIKEKSVTHSFEIMDLSTTSNRPSDNDFGFIIGVDLLDLLFPGGLPRAIYSKQDAKAVAAGEQRRS